MGSFSGAEVCELVGMYLLSQITRIIPSAEVALYWDDGVLVTKLRERKAEDLKKKLCEIFRKNGLKIHPIANVKVINFLDVTFDLSRGTHKPYTKPNHVINYVNVSSNHPPSVIKNIPLSVQRRLSFLSSNKEIFDAAAPPYQEALNRAGYKHKLEYEEPPNNNQQGKKKRIRKRNICYFTPPFNTNVKTRIGREFLKIIDKSFPPGNPLHGKLNRHNLKISYSTTSNMATHVSRHNHRVLSAGAREELAPCVCTQFECPLNGRCESNNVIYQATVTTVDNGHIETYVGVAANFKSRFRGHRTSINNQKYRSATTLSSYIWKLKEEKRNYVLKWRIIDRAPLYNPLTRKCNACNKEKFYIMYRRHMATLNRRSEVYSACKHRIMKLLSKS